MELAVQIAGGIILAAFALWALPLILALAACFLDALIDLFRWPER
jgi:hypothetical protein